MTSIRRRSPGALLSGIAATIVASVTIGYSSALWRYEPAPGGFVEDATDLAVRAEPTATEIAAFLPADRGTFLFPAPYGTQGYRLTTPADCAGSDCVLPGRPYWPALNNSAGSDTLYAVLLLAGHGGPTLFSVNKTSHAVSNLGPLFTSGPLAGDTTPGYYFSATAATTLYVPQPVVLNRYEILTQTLVPIFDISSPQGQTAFGLDRHATRFASSHDDLVHTFTVKSDTGTSLGCGVYREGLAEFRFIPRIGSFLECAPDKSGRYILLYEGTLLRSVDLQTNQEQTLASLPAGRRAFESGFGYVIAADWGGQGHGQMRRHFLDQPFTASGQGQLVTHLTGGGEDETRPSHTNAVAAPPASQYGCQTSILGVDDPAVIPREGELVCYPLDGSLRVLVVAPSMARMGGPGGATDDEQLPSASLDPTGEFMLWTSNMAGSGRLDAFIVRVPAHRLDDEVLVDSSPPTVAITAPSPSTTVSGNVTLQATAADDVGVVGVQFTVDGESLGTQDAAPPYSVTWNTTLVADGVRAIRAVAYDAAGNETTSSPVLVTVLNSGAPPAISNVNVVPQNDTSTIVLWNTSHLADSQVHYGLSAEYTLSTAIDPTLAGSHQQALTGLTPGTLYHFRVTSRNSAGQTVSSADLTFITPNAFGSELPRRWIDTRFALPAGGTTINVGQGGNLQDAIDAANPGDVIVLEAGATFLGSFALRNKPGAGWIYIVSSAHASMPAPGTRVNPSHSSLMPKIVSPNTESTITTDPGAHHYRFVGIEIATTWAATNNTNFAVVELGRFDQPSPNEIPHDLTFDRCYIHGTPTGNVRRGIAMNSAATALIDSYLTELHEDGADSQAVGGWNGPGPFKIVNNFLSAAGENVMFGGAEPSIPLLVPSDIEIRGNHIVKPLSWKPNDPSYAGLDWVVKNLMEFKNAQRVLVEGNVLENCWADDQVGIAVLFTGRNEEGTAPWSVVQDVTFRRNIVRHVTGAFNFAGTDSLHSSQRTARIHLQDNLIDDVRTDWGLGRVFSMNITAPEGQPLVGVDHLTIEHNTVFGDGAYGYTDSGNDVTKAQDNFTFRNNLVTRGQHGFGGTATADGQSTLNAYYITPIFVGNAIIGGVAGFLTGYPGNFFPATMAAVGFVDPAAGNYALAAGSPFRNAGTDGLDIGANIALVGTATASAISGESTGDAPAVSAVTVSNITGTTATITWTTDIAADSQVEYGPTMSYGNASPLDVAPVTTHIVQLTGLTQGTVYHFRVHSTNSAAWTTSSADAMFSTVGPPAISSVSASGITGAAATIAWQTDQAATSLVEYGLTTVYGNATTLDPALVTAHSQALTGLALGTTYHYRVVSTNSLGMTTTSGDASFTTIALPVLSAVVASQITGTTATIGWSSDQATTSQVEYGLTTDYGSTTILDSTPVVLHSQALPGLALGTTYHYRVISTNSVGLTATSADVTFTTASTPVVSAVAASAIAGTTATIAWTTDQATTSQVEFGLTTDYGSTTPLDPALVTSHSQGLTGLALGTTYHYRVISTNSVGLTATSGNATLTTVAAPVLSAVAASAITGTTATIAWTSDQATTSLVEYGVTTNYGSTTTLDSALVTSHSQDLGGLATGTTYHYRVVSTNAAGVSSTSGDATFTTIAVPVVSAVMSSAVTGTTATIAWTTDQNTTSQVEFGLTTDYGSTSVLDPALVTSHSQGLTGLALGTTYHYRVISTNSVGLTATSADATFTTASTPVVSAVAASAIAGTTATITWTSDQAATSQVEFGLTTDYGSATALDPALVTSHGQGLTGLALGTTYHYRVISTNGVGLTAASADATITTASTPVVSAVAASAIAGTTATIAWTTDQATTSQVEFGLTTDYGSTTPLDPALVTPHSQGLTGLALGTTYHYRVISTNGVGLTATSGDATFTTIAAPVVSGVTSSAITGTSATIAWTTDQNTSSQVEYGPTTAYGEATTLDPALVTSHSQNLTGLTVGVLYHYRVKSTNAVGLTSTSDDLTFTTAAVPIISGVSASAITTSTATILWTTDQPATSQVEYGLTTSYGATTTIDPALVTAHGQLLAGLAAGTTYHYRVSSANLVGLTATSEDFTFTTTAPPVISAVSATGVTGTAATIVWTTDGPASSQVEFGTTTAYGQTTTLDPALVTAHSVGLGGLANGTLYHYRVISTNAAVLTTTSDDFTFTTVATPIVSAVSASAIAPTSATITWTTDQGASTQVEYGATTDYGALTALDAMLVTAHSQGLSGLAIGTTYHYRVISTNAVGLVTTSGDFTFTTISQPVLSSIGATGITGTTAIVNWASDQATTSQVEYGPTTVYGLSTTLDGNLLTTHIQTLAGLSLGTLYHFRVISTNAFGLTATSDDVTFSTFALPIVSAVDVSAITGTSATVAWTTDQDATSQVQYGPTTAYGSVASSESLVTSHSLGLAGLAPGTTYHYRVVSANVVGLEATSPDATFTTIAVPTVSGVAASAVTGTTAMITWTTDQSTTTQVEYGTTTAYGSLTTLVSALVTSHNQSLDGLATGTTYHYRVTSTNSVGLIATSNDATFTTVAVPVLSAVSASAITGTTATISWLTDQATTSRVEYGLTTAYGLTTTLDPALVTSHSQNLSGLATGTTYHYRVTSTNDVELVATSSDLVFTTVAPPAVNDVIVVGTTATSVVIMWTTNQPADSQVDYGPTTDYGTTTTDPALTTLHAQTISNLTPGATYHFRVRSTNAVALTTSSSDDSFSMVAEPVISSIAISAVTGASAIVSWNTDQAADTQVEYGLTSAYGQSTALDPALATSHVRVLSGLSPGTTYHYRVRSTNEVGLTAISADSTFTTVAMPVISSVSASAITGTTASIAWTTDQPSSSLVEYGPTTAYGSAMTLDPALVTAHVQGVSGLSIGTTYHYRVISTNSVGVVATSGDSTFTTVAAPAISAVTTSGITGTAVTVTWTTDQTASSQVEYGLTTDYGSATALDAALVTSHAQGLAGLTVGTTYHYRVVSTNTHGLTSTSVALTFTTAAPPAVSGVSATSVTGSAATIVWTTDPPASSQVEYGTTTAYGNSTTLDPALVTSHSQALAGLDTGTLYHYRVISTSGVGLTTTSDDFTLTTVAMPVISGVTASTITGTGATVAWITDQATSSQIEYGPTTAYGSMTALDGTLTAAHGQVLTGLTVASGYHYRVKSTNAVGLTATSGDFTFTTAAPPAISAVSATGVTGHAATIVWTTDLPASSQIEFGTTTAYGNLTTLDPLLVTAHSQSLSGLAPGTTYHYRAVSTSAVGVTASSSGASFTTVAEPVISGIGVSGVTGSAATIAWITDQTTTSQVEYGLTTAYGNTTTLDSTLTTAHGQVLTGLTMASEYHYRVKSTNAVGLTATSGDFTLTTATPPAISAVSATGVTGTSATIGWTTDLLASSQVEFGTTTAYGNLTTLDPALVTAHSQSLSGLAPGTTYHYRVIAASVVGLTVTSPDASFTTVAEPVVSSIVVSGVTGSAATISWTTDQATSTQIDYGTTTAYGSTTALDSELTASHSQALAGLTPGTIYHYRVKSTNAVGLTATSGDFTFTTAAPPAISAVSATGVTGHAATIVWTTDLPASSQIEFGTTTTYGHLTTLDPALVTSHSGALAGLVAGTTYHYRVTSTSSVGLTAVSPDATFTTVAMPVVTGITVSAITGTSATVAWLTDQASTSQVEYGLTAAYGSSTILDPSLVASHSQPIAGLAIGTAYHYRVRSANAVGLVTVSGDATFTTVAPPVMSGVSALSIGRTSATVVWITNQPADSWVEYGATTAYGSATVRDSTLVTSHAVAFSGLSAETTYHYRVTSRNAVGLTSVSGDATFTTEDNPDPTVTLTLVKQGTGTGTVTGPFGINCGAACSSAVTSGMPMTLTALAGPGATFSGWSGACSGTEPSCVVTLTEASTVIATFSGSTPGDFDGDGYADLVWQHADGTLVLWTMQGGTMLSSSYLTSRNRTGGASSATETGPVLTSDSRVADPNWKIAATPDLDGNGKADLLWQNGSTGQLSAWIMQGAVMIRRQAFTPGTVDPSWHLQVAADFNSDGSVDLLWHQSGTNLLAVWFMDGTTRIGEQVPQPTTVPSDWRLVGSADFDRDGQLDLVWQSLTTGDLYLWYMNGTALRLEHAIGRFGDGWQARAVADFDLDGRPDIVWQKSSGELSAWFMNDATVVRIATLTPGLVNPAWTIVGAR